VDGVLEEDAQELKTNKKSNIRKGRCDCGIWIENVAVFKAEDRITKRRRAGGTPELFVDDISD
jgi:hypothetical protein